MTRLFYRPKRLQKKSAGPGRFDRVRRRTALFLCMCIILAMIPAVAFAANGYVVHFVNYDLSALDNEPIENVPEGAKLYKADELSNVEGFSAEEGCTWYLYHAGGAESNAFGPVAIPDPVRQGYQFRDWAAQGAADDTLYTVTGDTTFVARYISESQYVINLYYQFDNESNAVAAETTTIPYGLNAEISMVLPSSQALSGLNPQILTHSEDEQVKKAVNALNDMLKSDGTFTGSLDDTFLKNCRTAGYVGWERFRPI